MKDFAPETRGVFTPGGKTTGMAQRIKFSPNLAFSIILTLKPKIDP